MPEPTTVAFVRHALTDAVGRIRAARTPGVHLSAEGRRQAAALAGRPEAASLAAIYSSPLERALETAAPLAAAAGLEVRTCEGATEVDFGEWTGRTFTELETDPRWRAFNTARSVTPPPAGESMHDVQNRILRVVQDLRARHPGRTVAVVSHADVIRAAVCLFAGIPIDMCSRLEVRPASISTVRLGEDWISIAGIGESPAPGA